MLLCKKFSKTIFKTRIVPIWLNHDFANLVLLNIVHRGGGVCSVDTFNKQPLYRKKGVFDVSVVSG
jgi:hypothetical protein